MNSHEYLRSNSCSRWQFICVIGILLLMSMISPATAQKVTLDDSALVLFEMAMDLEKQGTAKSYRLALGFYQWSLQLIGRAGMASLKEGRSYADATFMRLWRAGTIYARMGNIYSTLGRPDSALVFYLKTYKNWQILARYESERWRRVTEVAPDAKILTEIAFAYQQLDKPDSALINYKRALKIWKGVDHPEGKDGMVRTLCGIAGAYDAMNKPDSANTYCRRAYDIWKTSQKIGEIATYDWFAVNFCRSPF